MLFMEVSRENNNNNNNDNVKRKGIEKLLTHFKEFKNNMVILSTAEPWEMTYYRNGMEHLLYASFHPTLYLVSTRLEIFSSQKMEIFGGKVASTATVPSGIQYAFFFFGKKKKSQNEYGKPEGCPYNDFSLKCQLRTQSKQSNCISKMGVITADWNVFACSLSCNCWSTSWVIFVWPILFNSTSLDWPFNL